MTALALLPGCLLLGWPGSGDGTSDSESTTSPDRDEDGYTLADGDCDDADPDEFPGVAWYPDDDGDGLGDASAEPSDCERASDTDVLDHTDCDDGDDEKPASDDLDCDGVAASLDCDDTDSSSTTMALDRDCDSVPTADDCDDDDGALGPISEDADCDGAIATLDCDDGDVLVGSIAADADCDGLLTAADCDDSDAASTAVAEDGDCDGTLAADDCDDGDSTSTILATDGDCDGSLTADDCDDGSATSTVLAEDGDCDGVLTAEDCDDANAALLARTNDADCDGAITSLDCDDADAGVQTPANDADCDGSLTGDDCDDQDPARFPDAVDAPTDGIDADCDGIDGMTLARAVRRMPSAQRGAIASLDGPDPGVVLGNWGDMTAAFQAGRASILSVDTLAGGSLGDDVSADTDVSLALESASLGWSVAWVDDLDGDGRAELLVGSRNVNQGTAYLIDGRDLASGGSLSALDAATSFTDDSTQNFMGVAVDALSLDGASTPHMAIGASNASFGGSTKGVVYLFDASAFSTSQTQVLSSADAVALFYGTTVSMAGESLAHLDVNGDQRDDLLVGAPGMTGAPGAAYLALGSATIAPTNDLTQAHAVFVGESAGDKAGQVVASAGDVDGDLLDDVLIASVESGGATGRVYLFFGSSLALGGTYPLADADVVISGEAAGDRAGFDVTGVGDVDGDGLDDLLIGAPYSSAIGDRSGQAALFLGVSLAGGGSFTLADADAAWFGTGNLERVGEAVGSIADVNGDGLRDLLIADQAGTPATHLVLSPFPVP